jgi:ectoine hydroxylase-related dioxygenase (phytanoyl-CoA dioxygenase family)
MFHNPWPGVPEERLMSRMDGSRTAETGAWAAALERDGFAIVPDVLGSVAVSELAEAIERIRPGATALERGGRVYAMRDLLRAVPEARRLAESAAVLACVEPVLGRGAFVVRGLLFDKTPEANWMVPWHQDLTIAVRRRTAAPGFGTWTVKGGVPHVQPPVAVLERMLTVRVHLDDSGADQGPLRVVPGSHTRGRLGVEATRNWLVRVPAVACLVPRGAALLMRPLLLHASSAASAPGQRRVVHLEFAVDPLPGGVAWFEAERDG